MSLPGGGAAKPTVTAFWAGVAATPSLPDAVESTSETPRVLKFAPEASIVPASVNG
jgi:hypothetical protein